MDPHRPVENPTFPVRGRWLIPSETSSGTATNPTLATLQTFHGRIELPPPEGALSASPGDWVEVSADGQWRQLTPNRASGSAAERSFWTRRILDPRRLHGTRIRREVEAGIRRFFEGRQFLETPTPLLVPCPGMEPHIRPYQTRSGAYLPTSPEFAMKRLLVGGLERIFQLSSAFREEPFSPHHRPEFRILEWYRAFEGYEAIQRDTEELIAFLAREILGCRPGEEALPWQGRTIRVAPPWPRLTVRDLFLEHLSLDLAEASVEMLAQACAARGFATSSRSWDDLMQLLWLNEVEPRLPQDQACFVTRYPPSQAALAVVDTDPDGTRWARRFEPYAAGLELGNAFEELTDPVEQRHRFEEDMALREAVYGAEFPRSPLDEEFLSALHEGMPPSGGIAVGVDRLVMLLADEPDIGFTLWLNPVNCSPSL
jgi:lysyl-tRNA synthetase class 2